MFWGIFGMNDFSLFLKNAYSSRIMQHVSFGESTYSIGYFIFLLSIVFLKFISCMHVSVSIICTCLMLSQSTYGSKTY